MKLLLTFLALLAAIPVRADQDQTFQDASTLARTNSRGAFDGITGATAEGVVPRYGVAPAEAQYFQGGRGNTQNHGVAKIQSCANYIPGQDRIANQECEAVNFLARNPDVRPQIDMGNDDPMITNNRNNREGAQDVFQTLGMNNVDTGCTTNTITNPARYSTETCTSMQGIEAQQCLVGREIRIDADANFQCDKTVTAFTSGTRSPTVTTSSCSYGRQINIDTDANFQCDKTVTSLSSVNRDPTIATSTCSYGRQINVDADSNFECQITQSAYETLKCRRTYAVNRTCDAATPMVTQQIASSWPWCDVCSFNKYGEHATLEAQFRDIATRAGNAVSARNGNYPGIWSLSATGGRPVTLKMNGVTIGSGYTFTYGGTSCYFDGDSWQNVCTLSYGVMCIDGACAYKVGKPMIEFVSTASGDCTQKRWMPATKDYPGHYACVNQDGMLCQSGATLTANSDGTSSCLSNCRWTTTVTSTCADLERRAQ